jgi:plastocyanin
MRRHIRRLLGLMTMGSIAFLWLALTPLASAGDPCYHGFTMPPASTETSTEIKVAPCAFAPTVTQVAVGASVTFRNGSDFVHLITGANQAWGSRDMELAPGSTVSYAFPTAGIYPYACALHRGMSGVIVVGDVAATAGGTSAGGTSPGTTTSGSAAAQTSPDTQPGFTLFAVAGLALAGALVGAVAGGSIVWVARRRRGAAVDETAAGVV